VEWRGIGWGEWEYDYAESVYNMYLLLNLRDRCQTKDVYSRCVLASSLIYLKVNLWLLGRRGRPVEWGRSERHVKEALANVGLLFDAALHFRKVALRHST
jgi:hypothetical protein